MKGVSRCVRDDRSVPAASPGRRRLVRGLWDYEIVGVNRAEIRAAVQLGDMTLLSVGRRRRMGYLNIPTDSSVHWFAGDGHFLVFDHAEEVYEALRG
jgi:hypothetical protein